MAEYNPSKIIKDGNTYNFRDDSKIPLAGSNKISGDLIPSTDGTVNLGSLSYQWDQAYIKSLTINGVACGDILTHNASEFVDVNSNQTIGGDKIFTHAAIGIGRDIHHFATTPYGKNTPPTTTSFQYVWFSGNTASQGFENGWYGGYLEQRIYTNGSAQGRWFIRDTSESAIGIELFVNGGDKQFRPQVNNTIDLGTSTNKWKTINGVEPSNLSLPSDTSITIDTTNFVWGRNFTFTPSVNGYLFISIAESTGIRRLSLKTGRGEYYFTNQNGILRFTFPVYKNKLVTILASSSITETVVLGLTLFTLQGNV